jgi:phage terminase large subunit-like protein
LRKAQEDVKAGREPDVAPEVLAERLLESVMPATPASWITDEYILGQATSRKVMPSDFLQLHACVAAESRNVWIPAEKWAACEEPGYEIPDGEDIYVAVDASISHDSTAIAWCARAGDDRVGGMAHVWSARAGSPAHEFVDGGRIRFKPVESFIAEVLNSRWRVVEVVYDPRFFEQSAQELSDLGFLVAAMNQQGVVMRGAEQKFHDAVTETPPRFVHGGDPVVSAHVAATVAEKTDVWKIRKAKNTAVIDATVAMVMAHDRAANAFRYDGPLLEVLV